MYAHWLVSTLGSRTRSPSYDIAQAPSAACVWRNQAYAARASSSRPQSVNAIAHSTWSHASVCPSAQGSAPLGCCARAMLSTVSRSSSEVRSCTGHRRLAQVDDDALADQRVEQSLGYSCRPGGAHHVPHEQPVVGLHQRVVALVDTDCALDPPVRRM